MKPEYPSKEYSQEARVLKVLLDADGNWVNKQKFCREMMFTQAGRAIFNLEHRYHWEIEHSDFTDEFGFKSYRIVQKEVQGILI